MTRAAQLSIWHMIMKWFARVELLLIRKVFLRAAIEHAHSFESIRPIKWIGWAKIAHLEMSQISAADDIIQCFCVSELMKVCFEVLRAFFPSVTVLCYRIKFSQRRFCKRNECNTLQCILYAECAVKLHRVWTEIIQRLHHLRFEVRWAPFDIFHSLELYRRLEEHTLKLLSFCTNISWRIKLIFSYNYCE